MKTENIEKLNSLEIYQKVAFEFKDGWNGLVYELGKDIEDLCKLANCELPLIQQIKEKFGTLRFYYNTLNSQYPKIIEKSIRALVSQAENCSSTICEICGEFGEKRVDGRLYKTVCKEHQGSSITVFEYEEMMKKHYEERRRAKEEVEQNPKPKNPFTLEPESCLIPALHALRSKRAKARYRVTLPTHVFSILKRLLPTRWLDLLLCRSA